MISVCFQGKPFSITVIRVYALNSNVEEAEQFYEDLQDLLALIPPKNVLYTIEYWSGLLFPSPGHLPNLGIEPESPALQANTLPSESFCY